MRRTQKEKRPEGKGMWEALELRDPETASPKQAQVVSEVRYNS